MNDFSEEVALRKIKKGENLERAGLRDLMLNHADLEGAKLCRADLEGANLEGTNLKQGDLSCANLREAYMAGADLEKANLQNADLEGANLEDANLKSADLRHANLAEATLERANLKGARLSFAQLEFANLGKAVLTEAQLDNANLYQSYLGAATLIKANLQHSRMDESNLEEANLSGANLTEAILIGAFGEGTDFTDACLRGAMFDHASLTNSNLKGADLRNCRFIDANLDRSILTAAKLFGIEAEPQQLAGAWADWVDFSAEGDGHLKVAGSQLVDCYQKLKTGLAEIPAHTFFQPKRFFGPGDVLRGATLEFREDSQVEIESYLENCLVILGKGTKLTVGPNGVLAGCQVTGAGAIEIWGRFTENGNSPGIVGPTRIHVGKSGIVTAVVQQAVRLTEFGFEHGCTLNLKIRKSPKFKGE